MHHVHRRPRRLLVALAAALLVAVTALGTTGAGAQTGAVQNGPDPTEAALERDGPYTVRSTTVSGLQASGFGGADIYYPVADDGATFGGVVVFPGFTASRSSMAWLARRVASHGFVVLNADTTTVLDQPAQRGTQMLAAIDHLRTSSPVAAMVDGERIGVMGHSMGGGGTLEAIVDDPSIDAAIPLTPWNLDKTWDDVSTPTLIIGAENDTIASVSAHALPFYRSLPAGLDRAYVELNGASHLAPNLSNGAISRYSISWLKRYVDGDERYAPFICPGPGAGGDLSDYQADCAPAGDPGTGGGDTGGGDTGDPGTGTGTGTGEGEGDTGRPWWCSLCWWLG